MNDMRITNIKKCNIRHCDILLCLDERFGIGQTEYADIELLNKATFLRDLLQIKAVPSKSTLRQRAYEIVMVKEIFRHFKTSIVDLFKMVSEFDRFKTNALLLQLVVLSFNCLRVIGQSSLKMTKQLLRRFNVVRRQLKSVMQNLIYIACKIVRHAGSTLLKSGEHNPWFDVYQQLHIEFA